jgi:hypothetical protein
MDERLYALNNRVAEAADAWLNDPRDRRIYSYLVDAIVARRAHVTPQLADHPENATLAEMAAPPGEDLDELGDLAAVAPLSDLVGGDPKAVLQRLRGESAPTAVTVGE